jgi:hypothetical protein
MQQLVSKVYMTGLCTSRVMRCNRFPNNVQDQRFTAREMDFNRFMGTGSASSYLRGLQFQDNASG